MLSRHVAGAHAGGGSPDEKQSGLQSCALAPSPAVGRWQRGPAVRCGCCSQGGLGLDVAPRSLASDHLRGGNTAGGAFPQASGNGFYVPFL